MKRHNNVKCDVNVKIKNKKSNPLHNWFHGVDLPMYESGATEYYAENVKLALTKCKVAAPWNNSNLIFFECPQKAEETTKNATFSGSW